MVVKSIAGILTSIDTALLQVTGSIQPANKTAKTVEIKLDGFSALVSFIITYTAIKFDSFLTPYEKF